MIFTALEKFSFSKIMSDYSKPKNSVAIRKTAKEVERKSP